MSDRVVVSFDKGVADVRLSRPEKMNALDSAMFRALTETGQSLAQDPSLRCVILSGEGRGFCAGLDVMSFSKPPSSGEKQVNLLDRPPGRPADRRSRSLVMRG